MKFQEASYPSRQRARGHPHRHPSASRETRTTSSAIPSETFAPAAGDASAEAAETPETARKPHVTPSLQLVVLIVTGAAFRCPAFQRNETVTRIPHAE